MAKNRNLDPASLMSDDTSVLMTDPGDDTAQNPPETNGEAPAAPPAPATPIADLGSSWLTFRAKSDEAEAAFRDALIAKGAINKRPFQVDGRLFTVQKRDGAPRVVEVKPIV